MLGLKGKERGKMDNEMYRESRCVSIREEGGRNRGIGEGVYMDGCPTSPPSTDDSKGHGHGPPLDLTLPH